MVDRPIARRGAAVGAGAADQGALPDVSGAWRHAARLRAVKPVLDAGARSGAGFVRGAGAAGCRLRYLAARPPQQLAAGVDAGVRSSWLYHRSGSAPRAHPAAGHAMARAARALRTRG